MTPSTARARSPSRLGMYPKSMTRPRLAEAVPGASRPVCVTVLMAGHMLPLDCPVPSWTRRGPGRLPASFADQSRPARPGGTDGSEAAGTLHHQVDPEQRDEDAHDQVPVTGHEPPERGQHASRRSGNGHGDEQRDRHRHHDDDDGYGDDHDPLSRAYLGFGDVLQR